jgi:hypothetical protein
LGQQGWNISWNSVELIMLLTGASYLDDTTATMVMPTLGDGEIGIEGTGADVEDPNQGFFSRLSRGKW